MLTQPTCVHENKCIVWSTYGSGGYPLQGRQLRWQCQDCGALLANALAHNMSRYDTPDVDLPLLKRFLGSTARRAQSLVDGKQARPRWELELKEKYASYLGSEEC